MKNKPTLSKEAEKLFNAEFILDDEDQGGNPSPDYLLGEYHDQVKQFVAQIEQSAILAEMERVNAVLNSFVIEDEFYGKGLAELQIEVIIVAIKTALTETAGDICVTHKPPQGTPGRQFIENAEKGMK